MQAGLQGLEPAPGLARRFNTALNASPDMHHSLRNINWTIVERVPLLDSANMTPSDWESISQACLDTEGLSGLIIIHGTDTLSYTASALAYLLAGISIPVVITGSQKPLDVANSDALGNLRGSMLAASKSEAGVWVYFDQQLMPAARTVKKDAIHLNGFAAPRANASLCAQAPGKALKPQVNLRDWVDVSVAVVQMLPGYSVQQLSALIDTRPCAIILELYGLGTLADQDINLLVQLRKAQNRNIVLVAISQCYVGTINFDIYAPGQALKQLGVLNARDMTLEAAYSKLMLLFHLGYSDEEIRQLFLTPIANEMSPEST